MTSSPGSEEKTRPSAEELLILEILVTLSAPSRIRIPALNVLLGFVRVRVAGPTFSSLNRASRLLRVWPSLMVPLNVWLRSMSKTTGVDPTKLFGASLLVIADNVVLVKVRRR